MRPWSARTCAPPSSPKTRRPRWPGTGGAGTPGRLAKGTATWEPSRSAKAPRPDPRTTATGEESDGRRRAARAARAQARASSVQAGTSAAYTVLFNHHELRGAEAVPAAGRGHDGDHRARLAPGPVHRNRADHLPARVFQ